MTVLASSADGDGAFGIIRALIDESLVGLLLLDDAGAVVEANACGRQELSAAGGLCERHGRAVRPSPRRRPEVRPHSEGSARPSRAAGPVHLRHSRRLAQPAAAYRVSEPSSWHATEQGRHCCRGRDRGPLEDGSGECDPGRQVAWPDASRGVRGCLVGRRHGRMRDRGSAKPEHGVRASVGQTGTGQDLVLPPGRPGPSGPLGFPIACAARLSRPFRGRRKPVFRPFGDLRLRGSPRERQENDCVAKPPSVGRRHERTARETTRVLGAARRNKTELHPDPVALPTDLRFVGVCGAAEPIRCE